MWVIDIIHSSSLYIYTLNNPGFLLVQLFFLARTLLGNLAPDLYPGNPSYALKATLTEGNGLIKGDFKKLTTIVPLLPLISREAALGGASQICLIAGMNSLWVFQHFGRWHNSCKSTYNPKRLSVQPVIQMILACLNTVLYEIRGPIFSGHAWPKSATLNAGLLLPKAGMIWRWKTWRWHEPNKNGWVMFEATSIIWPKQTRKRSTLGSIIGIMCVRQRKRVCKLSTFFSQPCNLGRLPISISLHKLEHDRFESLS